MRGISDSRPQSPARGSFAAGDAQRQTPPSTRALRRRTLSISRRKPPGNRRSITLEPHRAVSGRLHAFVYARHGREFIGCKSRVRDGESEGGQFTK
jgi:hypothetical protein